MDSEVIAWGRGDSGQLGLGASHDAPSTLCPTVLPNLPTSSSSDSAPCSILSISSGADHSALLTSEGKVFTCGSNDFKQLGHDKTQSRMEGVNALQQYEMKAVSCGGHHTLALDAWGKVFSWGRDDRGQLGQNTGEETAILPKMIRGLGTMNVIQIAAGFRHSLALTDSGKLFAFGDNTYGQLGLGNAAGDRALTPQPVESLDGLPIRAVAAGGFHSVVVTWSGAVYVWGKNNYGQLGLGSQEDQKFPYQCRSLRSQFIAHVSCGKEHTACLTANGGVFTFGCGDFGQLGHGNKDWEARPRQVMELMGTEVSQLACGNRHTLAYVPSRKRMYAFGLGGSGQLGSSHSSSSATPIVVQGAWGAPSAKSVYLIAAGGDQSFCCTRSNTSKLPPLDHRQLAPRATMKTLTPEMLEKISDASPEDCVDQDFLEQVETVFQSRASLNASLLTPTHRPCMSRNSGLDIPAWIKAFNVIKECKHDTIRDAIDAAVTQFVIPQMGRTPPDVETLRLFLTLPLYHGFEDPERFEELHTPFGRHLTAMEKIPWAVVERWFKEQGADYLRPFVANFKRVVVHLMRLRSDGAMSMALMRALEVCLVLLRILNRINVEKSLIIDYEDFYVSELVDLVDLPESYGRWLLAKAQVGGATASEFHICNFPFLFDAMAKTKLLQVDQAIQMQHAMGQAHQNALLASLLQPAFGGMHADIPYLVFTVDRENLLQDTLTQIQCLATDDLKKPMRVQFSGEEAEDAGGVTKEFFLLLLRELLDPKFGMFKEYDEETRAIWFHPHCFEDNLMFFLVGVICGLAIYNFTIINLPFPLALYKKLLGDKVEGIEDMEKLSPSVARGLQSLLAHPDPSEVESVFCLNFSVSEECFGDVKVVPLKENGENIAVTGANREEYVRLHVDHVMNKSVENQFNAFHQGFSKVCGGRVLDLFHARELMSLVVGNENYNWEAFEEAAQYKNGYTAEDETIRFFWSVFHELTESEKRKFLLFLTGCDRVPILGMKALTMTVQRTGDVDYLPVAHTCFNLLDLPPYATREKLRYKLLIAIQHAEGFGLA